MLHLTQGRCTEWEDLTRWVTLVTLKALAQERMDPGVSWRTYLWGVVVRVIKNWRKKRLPDLPGDEHLTKHPDGHASVEVMLEKQASRDEALKDVSPEFRQLLELLIQGKTFAEARKILGKTPGAMKSFVHRELKAFRSRTGPKN